MTLIHENGAITAIFIGKTGAKAPTSHHREWRAVRPEVPVSNGYKKTAAAVGEIPTRIGKLAPTDGQQTIQSDLASSVKCSTVGGPAKKEPTILRHSVKAGDWRKSTVWFSSVSQKIVKT